MEIPGFEPGAFRMQSGRAATALHPPECATIDVNGDLVKLRWENNEKKIEKVLLHRGLVRIAGGCKDKKLCETCKNNLEIPGFEPGAFRMQSGRAATALYPRRMCQWSYHQEPSLQTCDDLRYKYCTHCVHGFTLSSQWSSWLQNHFIQDETQGLTVRNLVLTGHEIKIIYYLWMNCENWRSSHMLFVNELWVLENKTTTIHLSTHRRGISCAKHFGMKN
jgi:hypothetical protein